MPKRRHRAPLDDAHGAVAHGPVGQPLEGKFRPPAKPSRNRRKGLLEHAAQTALGADVVDQHDLAARPGDARELVERRAPFISKPVQVPKELPPAKQLFQILEALSVGKNPFGILAFGAKSHQPAFEAVRVAGLRPNAPHDWQHVRVFIEFSGAVTSLSARWESLKLELSAPNDLSFTADSLSLLDALTDTLHTCLIGVPGQMANISKRLSAALGNRDEANAILRHPTAISAFAHALSRHVSSIRLTAVTKDVAEAVAQFDGSNTDLAGFARQILTELVGKPSADIERLTRVWQGMLSKLGHIRALEPFYDRITNTCG